MRTLGVKNDYVLLNIDGGMVRNRTDVFLGNAITMLQNEFSDCSPLTYMLKYRSGKIKSTNDQTPIIWGLREDGESLLSILSYIDGRDFFYPSLVEIEKLRMAHNIRSAPTSSNYTDTTTGEAISELTFHNIESVFHVLLAVLHYYALNEYAIRKCKLCGQYFAIPPGKTNPKESFCTRSFSYTNWEGIIKQYKSCKDARKKIFDASEKRRASVYSCVYSKNGKFVNGNYVEIDTFMDEVKAYKDAIKKDPSIQNLIAYERYLYIDCQEKYYRRYGRRK